MHILSASYLSESLYRLWLVIAVVCLLLGCQSLPKQPHLPTSIEFDSRLEDLFASSSIENRSELTSAIHKQQRIHEGLSGYHTITTGSDAFAARSILSGMATRSIDVQYYIWHNDQAGQLMLQDLWQAAERGVIVRFLLDDFNSSPDLDQQLRRFASHPNIAVRLVNPFIYRQTPAVNFITSIPRINRRMHNKSMIFDRQISILGGRNIGNEYLSNDQNSQFADLDVMLIGTVLDDINASFEQYWQSDLAYDVETLVQPDRKIEFVAGLDLIEPNISNGIHSSKSVYQQAVETSTIDIDLINMNVPFKWVDVYFLSDDASKLNKTSPTEDYLVHQLRYFLGRPDSKLTIISSYFVPTKHGVETLEHLAAQGIKIKILTNSFDATDVAVVHSGYAQWRYRMLKAGIDIYELKSTVSEDKGDNKLWKTRSQSSTSLHAKSFAVDDEHVFIGSYNVDPRSANINTEMGVIINDPKLAEQLHTTIDDNLLNQAYQVKLSQTGQLEWHTIESGQYLVHNKEPKMGTSQRIWVTILSILPIDWLL